MIRKLFDRFNAKTENGVPKGLGVTELPKTIYQDKQLFKSSDFKNIVNDIFQPRIHEFGFKGKDFIYFRENSVYTETVFFWTFKYGGAIAIDLFVKFKNIRYPDEKKILSAKEIRSNNTDFQSRLSPNGEQNKQGQSVWFWIYEDTIEKNKKIVEDIWRIFSIRGIEYFENFINHKNYIEQITTKNYQDFPGFFMPKLVGRHQKGLIYFLFEYWRQIGDKKKSIEFAKLGLTELTNESDGSYLAVFKNYLQTVPD
jgi:hypothetical protein